MKPERFARIKELLLGLADLSATERVSYLDDKCEDDPELRHDVESMLAVEGNAPEILQTRGKGDVLRNADSETPTVARASDVPDASDPPYAAGAAGVAAHPSSDLPGEIADYRIIRKLGEGGMGVVYEAEQQNPRRAVALKVVRGGAFVDDYNVRLFQREAQSLARLKHPAIAAIYEAGRTDEGQHFFAMELVHGVTLAEHLKERSIPGRGGAAAKTEIEARLALFAQICSAVAYAHQRGVIHRDLKPANILVVAGETGAGADASSTESKRLSGSTAATAQVKILDFGLARITDTDVAMTTVVSEIGKIQGTLPYMSPEQARGNPAEIDLRSDVYALGVILYEMLTGQLPYDVECTLIHEAVRVICEEEPRRPSTVVRTLRGDVETIALKALEKSPEQRYQTAQALADDIERYLSDEPILARPPSTTYQLRKLVARHRAPFAFAAAIFVLLVAFGITMTSMYGAQRREHRRAEQNLARASTEAEKATRINQFLQDMLSSIDPEYAQGREVTVREILDEAAGQIETSLADQPEVRAAIEGTIGKTYEGLGLRDEAEQHLQAAVDILRSLPDADPENLVYCLNELAWVLIHGREDFAAADSILHEAHLIGDDQLGDDHRQSARTLYMQSDLLRHLKDYDAAEAKGREALALQRRIFNGPHREIAMTLNNIGLVLYNQEDYAGAERYIMQALEMNRTLRDDRHPAVATQLINLGQVLIDKGDYARAERYLREALAIRQDVFGEEHAMVANVLRLLGELSADQGDYDRSERLYQECLDMQQRLFGNTHLEVAETLWDMVDKLQGGRDYAALDKHLGEALRIRHELQGNNHPQVFKVLQTRAFLLQRNGDHEKALPIYLDIVERQRQEHAGQDHLETAKTLNSLGYVCQIMGDDAESVSYFREALRMREKLLGDDHSYVASTLAGLGGSLVGLGRPKEAEPLLRRALSIYQVKFPPGHAGHVRVAYIQSELGAALTAQARYAQAEEMILGAHAIMEASETTVMARRKRCLGYLIQLYEAKAEMERAVPYREQLRRLDEPKKKQ